MEIPVGYHDPQAFLSTARSQIHQTRRKYRGTERRQIPSIDEHLVQKAKASPPTTRFRKAKRYGTPSHSQRHSNNSGQMHPNHCGIDRDPHPNRIWMGGGPSKHTPTPYCWVQTVERCVVHSSTQRSAREEGRHKCQKQRQ